MNSVFIAWKMARIYAVTSTSEKGVKTYGIRGQMFFATMTHFIDLFDLANDPRQVFIDFQHTHVWDHASVTGIQRVVKKYEQLGKSVTLIGLNTESKELLRKSGYALSA